MDDLPGLDEQQKQLAKALLSGDGQTIAVAKFIPSNTSQYGHMFIIESAARNDG